MTGCERETLINNESPKELVVKSSDSNTQIEKVNNLLSGINDRITTYNASKNRNAFFRKYGKLNINQCIIVRFPNIDKNEFVVIPLTSRKNEKKLFIAYYKNGNKEYTVISGNKQYHNKNRSSTEKAFIKHLSTLVYLTYKTDGNVNKNKSVNSFGMQDCNPNFLYHDYENCRVWYIYPCNGETFYISSLDKGDVCGDVLDEVIVDAPYEPEPDPVPNSPWENPDIPDEPNPDYNEPAGCDEMEFDCEEDGLGNEEEEDDDFKVQDSLKKTAKCVYDKLKESNGNLLKKTIGKFIKDPKYHLLIKHGNCNAASATACTDGSKIGTTGEVTIIIEGNGYGNSLELAGDILHEGIHAEIFRYVNRFKEGEDPNNRKRLFDLYRHYSEMDSDYPEIDAQHQYMVENYVTPIAQSIRTLDGNKRPLEDYMGFGWKGLEQYGFYGTLTRSQMDEYYRLMAEIEENTNFNNDCEE